MIIQYLTVFVPKFLSIILSSLGQMLMNHKIVIYSPQEFKPPLSAQTCLHKSTEVNEIQI